MKHKHEAELNKFLKFAGYNQDVYEFTQSTGITLTYPNMAQNYNKYIGIQNVDPLYKSYTQLSCVDLQPKDSLETGFTDTTIKKFKSRVSAKISQRRKLERIRSTALATIPTFIHLAFGIQQELVTPEEIHFQDYCKFKVGGAMFGYYGTISALDFNIYTIPHESYRDTYKKTVSIHHHFTDRQPGLLKP